MLGIIIIIRTLSRLWSGEKSVCVIHEVEVDTIKKDNLSLYHYSVFIAVLF